METVAPSPIRPFKLNWNAILGVYEGDNASAWDMQPDGHYVRRRPEAGQPRREAQQLFIQLAAEALSSSSGEKAGHDQD